jgi:hypothetical protein
MAKKPTRKIVKGLGNSLWFERDEDDTWNLGMGRILVDKKGKRISDDRIDAGDYDNRSSNWVMRLLSFDQNNPLGQSKLVKITKKK